MADYFIGFWNLENLFAPEGFPAREPWIAKKNAKDLKGWSQALFDRKVSQLNRIISQMNGGSGPDLLGVCEVENRYALDALADAMNGALPGRNYKSVHADSTKDKRGIDTAFIYDAAKFIVKESEIFSHFVMRRTGTRDITQATFVTLEGNELVVLSNHWPSRSGGAAKSAGFRATAGETLGYWHQRIREEKTNDIAVLAFGDLNDEPFDPSVIIHANAKRERDDVKNSTSAVFYNLSWNYLSQRAVHRKGKERILYGTYYFAGNGNVLDQILVSRSLLVEGQPLRVVEESARMETFPELVDHRKSYGALGFGLPEGDPVKNVDQDGYSDHFPVSVIVKERD